MPTHSSCEGKHYPIINSCTVDLYLSAWFLDAEVLVMQIPLLFNTFISSFMLHDAVNWGKRATLCEKAIWHALLADGQVCTFCFLWNERVLLKICIALQVYVQRSSGACLKTRDRLLCNQLRYINFDYSPSWLWSCCISQACIVWFSVDNETT